MDFLLFKKTDNSAKRNTEHTVKHAYEEAMKIKKKDGFSECKDIKLEHILKEKKD